MTKGTFEDRPLGESEYLLKEPELHKNGYFKNLGRVGHWYLRIEDKCSKRNIFIALCLMILFVFTCLPFLKYTVLTFDRHHFGYFTEKLPPLLKSSV